jgi:peptidyl-prolyl cis-trans isomerase D
MATITKIRQNSGLVLIVIGLGMGAFIMGDMFRGGGGREAQYVGEIAGHKIDRLDFENRVNIQLESLRSINQSPDATTTTQIRNQVWNEMLREYTVMVELKEAGISVSQDEYDDVRWGDNVIPSFRSDPNFNPEGQFNPDAVKQYFSFISKQYPLYAQVQQKQIIESRETAKYYKAISSGLKSNNLESLEMARSNDSKISFDFVYKRYNAIPDSIVNVSESDLNSYYHEHKGDKKYKQNESRNVSFVTYNVVASEDDKKFLEKDIALLIRDFKTAESDSVFVLENADTKTGFNQIYIEGSIADLKTDSMIVNAAIGDVIGPYLDRNSFKIAKVSGENFEEQARVRHILLKTTGINDDQIKQRADSIKNVIRRQRNFDEMVTTYSEDVASIKDGGVYEWFPQGRMVTEFNDAVFDGKKGDLVVVKTSYGYHIIEILGQREQRQPLISVVDHEIIPSTDTFNEVYTEATDFSINNNDEASFKESAKGFDLNITEANKVLKGSKNVSGVSDASEFVRWIYQADLDEVSSPIEIGDKFIVAIVTKITKEGEPEFDDIKDLFKGFVILDKKKELIIAEMEGITDLAELATSLSLQVQTASTIPYSSNTIPGGGSGEDEVIGEAFTLEVGDVSVPLTGMSGVYVIEITDKQMPLIDDLDSELFADDINLKYETMVNTGVFSALREDADVVDNRAEFY